MANIALLRQAPSLVDIPGQLRQLADAIEAGAHGEVASMLVLVPREGDYPSIWGWGDVSDDNRPIIQLELAKAWFILNRTARA